MDGGDEIRNLTVILDKAEQASANQSQGCIRLEPKRCIKVRRSRGLRRKERNSSCQGQDLEEKKSEKQTPLSLIHEKII